VVAWVVVFWQGLSTAIDIWLISEIFNHCLFVLPGAAFLIYLKRNELDLTQFKPNYLVSVLCIGCLTLYAIGLAGDVQLFMHVATFTFLPLSIWAFIGNHLAYKILFPLVFVLFCIPIGEELIPALQEITADLSVVMLNWTGIPIYRSGLYIEIPQGRFLVAEACSGISFFIASIVIGSLYSYLNIQSAKRRILFMSISIAFPIIANAIRVFGIILTGHLTDMKHAVGADHLIYGWVFFSLVIVCLLGIGELIREKHQELKPQNKVTINLSTTPYSCYKSSFSLLLIMLVFFVWFKSISTQLSESSSGSNLVEQLTVKQMPTEGHARQWKPAFIDPYQELQYAVELADVQVDVYIAWYPRGKGELISSLNKLYTEKSWTLESNTSYQLDDGQAMPVDTIVNPQSKRLLSHWYVIDGEVFTDNRIAKLYEIYRVMIGTHIGSGLIAVSQETENVSWEQDKTTFEALTKANLEKLNQQFNFE
jgi:exosortase A